MLNRMPIPTRAPKFSLPFSRMGHWVESPPRNQAQRSSGWGTPQHTLCLVWTQRIAPSAKLGSLLKTQNPPLALLLGSCATPSSPEDTTRRMGLSGGCGHSFLTHDFLLPLPGCGTRNLYSLKVVSRTLSLLGGGGVGGSLPSFPQEMAGKGARPLVPDPEVSTIPPYGSEDFLCVGRG